MPMIFRRFLLSSLVTCTSLVVALGFVEAGVRIFWRGSTASSVWSDRPQRYFIPETALNLRGNRPLVPGEFQIAVIGDSITFGPYIQADDTFSARLERLLALNEGVKPIRIINLGTSGASTAQEIESVTRAIERGANAIILQITLNDPELAPLRDAGKIFGGYHPDSSFTQQLFSWWKTGLFVATRLHNQRSQKLYVQYFQDLFSRPETRNRFIDSLGQIAKVTQDKNIPVIAMVFPLFGYPLDENYPFKNIHEDLHHLLDERKIPALDLSEAFAGIPSDRLQVMPGEDLHPNEIAHRIAAEKLYEFLLKEKIIPQEYQIKRRYPERLNFAGVKIKGE